MSEAGLPPPLAWKRWLPGSDIIRFLALSAGLWVASLLAAELRQPEFVVGFLAAAAFLPLLLLGVRVRTRPLWALQVRGDGETVDGVVRDATRNCQPTQVGPDREGAERLFRRCETLLRLEAPSCLLGIQRANGDPGTTLLLLPRSRDRKSLDTLRETIAARLAGGC